MRIVVVRNAFSEQVALLEITVGIVFQSPCRPPAQVRGESAVRHQLVTFRDALEFQVVKNNGRRIDRLGQRQDELVLCRHGDRRAKAVCAREARRHGDGTQRDGFARAVHRHGRRQTGRFFHGPCAVPCPGRKIVHAPARTLKTQTPCARRQLERRRRGHAAGKREDELPVAHRARLAEIARGEARRRRHGRLRGGGGSLRERPAVQRVGLRPGIGDGEIAAQPHARVSRHLEVAVGHGGGFDILFGNQPQMEVVVMRQTVSAVHVAEIKHVIARRQPGRAITLLAEIGKARGVVPTDPVRLRPRNDGEVHGGRANVCTLAILERQLVDAARRHIHRAPGGKARLAHEHLVAVGGSVRMLNPPFIRIWQRHEINISIISGVSNLGLCIRAECPSLHRCRVAGGDRGDRPVLETVVRDGRLDDAGRNVEARFARSARQHEFVRRGRELLDASRHLGDAPHAARDGELARRRRRAGNPALVAVHACLCVGVARAHRHVHHGKVGAHVARVHAHRCRLVRAVCGRDERNRPRAVLHESPSSRHADWRDRDA